jgi:hypothetical protein
VSGLSDADRAYAAALLDQFGRLTLRPYQGTELPEVIVQGKVAALGWLGERTGAKVIEIPKAYNAHRCAEHCTEKHMHVESTTQRWSVTGARATIVLHTLQGYMRVQDRRARELVEAGQRIGYKRTVVDEMRELGWDIPELREAAWAPVDRRVS